MNTVTVAQLKAALNQLGPGHDEKAIRVWLPGSKIALSNVFISKGEVMIEGNVEPGSALDFTP